MCEGEEPGVIDARFFCADMLVELLRKPNKSELDSLREVALKSARPNRVPIVSSMFGG